jgi:hypothetical protein
MLQFRNRRVTNLKDLDSADELRRRGKILARRGRELAADVERPRVWSVGAEA